MSETHRRVCVVLAACLIAAPALATEREACTNRDPLRRPFFGDSHVHTAYSFDASSQDTRNTPRDAYRFAKGEEVGLQLTMPTGTPCGGPSYSVRSTGRW